MKYTTFLLNILVLIQNWAQMEITITRMKIAVSDKLTGKLFDTFIYQAKIVKIIEQNFNIYKKTLLLYFADLLFMRAESL